MRSISWYAVWGVALPVIAILLLASEQISGDVAICTATLGVVSAVLSLRDN